MSGALSSAFSSVGNAIGHAGNVIGGVLSSFGNKQQPKDFTLRSSNDDAQEDIEYIGRISQLADAIHDVKATNEKSATMMEINANIVSNMNDVGELAGLILNSKFKVSELRDIVERMFVSKGNKPTPIEHYVGMVTKTDTKNATYVKIEKED